jgi:hypothetical protein
VSDRKERQLPSPLAGEGLGERGRWKILVLIGIQRIKHAGSIHFYASTQIKRFAYTLSPTPLPSRERGFYIGQCMDGVRSIRSEALLLHESALKLLTT